MNKIDGLLSELCPEGVQKFPLGELARVEKGQQVNRESLRNDFPFPVYNGGVNPSGRHIEANFPANTITVSQGGASAGFVNFVREPLWVGAHCFAVIPRPEIVNRFLFFSLKFKEDQLQRSKYGAGIPALDKASLTNLSIALPPIEIQIEIVSILDKFTGLEAELEAELEARRIQYEVVRDRLFDFSGVDQPHLLETDLARLCPGGVPFQKLGELVRIRNGRDYKHLEPGTVPVYGSGGVMTYVSEPFFASPSVLIPRKGSLGNLFFVNVPFWTVDTIFYTEIGEKLEPKYLYYYLKTIDLESMNLAGGVPSMTQAVLNKLSIPLPPLEIQRNVVTVLDKLDALVNDITIGLPAELTARRKQYEYYRDKLLTFKEPESA